jgi:hypothetical protein
VFWCFLFITFRFLFDSLVSMGWDCVSELQPLPKILLNPWWWYELESDGGMILTRKNRGTRRRTCPSAALSTMNPTWIDPGANSGLRGERPGSNHLSHVTARFVSAYSIQSEKRLKTRDNLGNLLIDGVCAPGKQTLKWRTLTSKNRPFHTRVSVESVV